MAGCLNLTGLQGHGSYDFGLKSALYRDVYCNPCADLSEA